jgi:ABC-type multidrug transport system permease subunit
MQPLFLLTQARFKEFIREPSAIFWTFGFPILLTVALGLAFRNQRSPETPVGIVADASQPERAAALIAALQPEGLKPRLVSKEEGELGLRHSELALVISLSEKRYLYDPVRPEAQLARERADRVLQQLAGQQTIVPMRDEKIEAAGSRYIDWLIPGLIGTQLMGGSLWGIAFAIVEARQKKLLKRLVATPMRRSDFLISFVLWRLLFVLIEIAVLLSFANLAFSVPVRGSLLAVFALCLLGAACFAGIGLLCASRAKNTETANGLVNLVQLPMYMLSGVFFSSSRFPDWAQTPIRLLPLTALNDALRGVINEGQGLAALSLPILIIVIWGFASGFMALRLFRWV